MIVEFIAAGVFGTAMCVSSFLGGRYKKSIEATKEKNDNKRISGGHEIIKWSWIYKDIQCFLCPKCNGYQPKTYHPKICACFLMNRSHFHFKCRVCEFKGIMKTVDDK